MKGQNENMIKECSDSSDFTGAMHSKTIQTFEQNYHSELVDCMISPIGGTPYFLVVYNKKSNESERLWYTIFFTYPCMIALFVFVILLFGMINILKRTSTNHNLKTKNLQFDWIWPRKENKKQYWLICAFNLFILLFTSLYLGFDFIAGSVTVETHYTMFLLLIFSINILFSLGFTYFNLTKNDAPNSNPKSVFIGFAVVLMMLFLTATFFYGFFWAFSTYILFLVSGMVLVTLAYNYTKGLLGSLVGFSRKFLNRITDTVLNDRLGVAKQTDPHSRTTTSAKETLTDIKTLSEKKTGISGELSITSFSSIIFLSWLLISCIAPSYFLQKYAFTQINTRLQKDYQLYYANNYTPYLNLNKDKTDFSTKGIATVNTDSVFLSRKPASTGVADCIGNDEEYNSIIEFSGDLMNPGIDNLLPLGKNSSDDILYHASNEKNNFDSTTFNWAKENDKLTLHYSGNSDKPFYISSKLWTFVNPLKFGEYYMMFMLLMLIIFMFTQYMLRRFFTKGFIQPWSDQHDLIKTEVATYKHLLVTGIPLSGKYEAVRELIKDAYLKNEVLEIGALGAIKDMAVSNHKIFVFRNLEYDLSNLAAEQVRLELIEKMISSQENPQIILLSDSEPLVALKNAIELHLKSAAKTDDKDSNDDTIKMNIERWNNLLGKFHNCYYFNNAKPHISERNRIPKLWTDIIENECRMGTFLPQIAEKIAEEIKGKHPKDWYEIIWLIQSHSKLYYHSIWNSLSPEERYIVYDIAIDNLLNTKNANLINLLHQKGVFVSDHEMEKISLFNESFRNFVLTEITQHEIDTMNKRAKKDSEWSNFKTPILIVIISLVVLLTIANGSSLLSYAAMLLTGLSLLQRIFTGFNQVGIGNSK